VLFGDSFGYHDGMPDRSPQDRVPLYVRLPRDQAVALDRLVDATGQRKQHLVSELLADRLEVGRADLAERPWGQADEVLTLEEVALLLRLPPDALESHAKDGDLPGRRVAGEWRFARSAVLRWLSEGERSGHGSDAGGSPREGA
jgi:excisionase family DNA binding protein